MIPETNYMVSESETAATGDAMAIDICLEPLAASKTHNYSDTSSSRLSTITTSYLHRIPSGSRQWEIYLKDLVDSRAKRSVRAKREKESVNDFLQRFPIFEP